MKTRREWFNNLPADAKKHATANSSEEQLNTPKASLYDSLCDEDGFSFFDEPGDDYWMKIAGDVWAAENPTAAQKTHHKHTV